MHFIVLDNIGTPTRIRKKLDLPVSALIQTKSQENPEVDNKMKEIMKMNGILNINGKVCSYPENVSAVFLERSLKMHFDLF